MDASLESLFLTELLANEGEGEGEGEMFSSQGIAMASMEDDTSDINFSCGSEVSDYLNDEMFCSTDMAMESAPSHCVNQSSNASSARDTTTILEERPVKKINVGSSKPAGYKPSSFVLSFAKPCTLLVTDETAMNGRHHVGSLSGVNDKAGTKNSLSPSSSSSNMFLKNQNNLEATCGIQESKSPVSVTKGTKRGTDHIIAERLRREKIAELFISLSALIPGLKKIDKTSVLSDAIKYLKQLQDRVKILESKTKTSVHSPVSIQKTQFINVANADDSNASCISSVENPNMDISGDPMPEVVVRVADKYVLVRIHSPKHSGVLANIYKEIEKLHLTVVNSSALPYGDSSIEVTIVAQMADAYKMTAMDIASTLRMAIMAVG